MTESLEDQLFRVRADMGRENRELKGALNEAIDLLNAIWEQRELTQELWTRIAEVLECPEDETPIVYSPEVVTKSDLLKLERRVAKLEHSVLPSEPIKIPT